MKTDTVAELLARHAELMNRHGPDSEEVAAFVREHAADVDLEFAELAETARRLKLALTRGRAAKGGRK